MRAAPTVFFALAFASFLAAYSFEELGRFAPQNASFGIVNFTSHGEILYAIVSSGNVHAFLAEEAGDFEPVLENIESPLHDYYIAIGYSPEAVDQFETVHIGIRNISERHKTGVEKCRILTGADRNSCTDFDSCQKACYSVTSFCLPVALSIGRPLINAILDFENKTRELDDAYENENTAFALFSSDKSHENIKAYLSSIERINRAATAASINPLYDAYSYCYTPDYSLPIITSLQVTAYRYYNSASPFYFISEEAGRVKNRTLEGIEREYEPPSNATNVTIQNIIDNKTNVTENISGEYEEEAPSLDIVFLSAAVTVAALIVAGAAYFFAERKRKGLHRI